MSGASDYIVSMPRADTQLATPFRRALLYVVQKLGAVNVTKLEKILYLADLEHYLIRGQTITGARWVRYTNGPIAKAVVPSTRLMQGHEIVMEREEQGTYEAHVYRPGPDPRFDPGLDEAARDTLDRIIELTRHLNSTEAIRVAYSTAPMRVILHDEAKAGGQAQLNRLIQFRLDDASVAAAAGIRPAMPEDDRAEFKRRELDRIADLREVALAAGS